MSTDSTFTTETLTQELKEVKNWGRVAHEIALPESVRDTVRSLENAEEQGPFLIAHLVDSHPLYGWEDVIKGMRYADRDREAQLMYRHPLYGWEDVIEGVEDEDNDIADYLTRKYGGGRCGLMDV